MGSKTKTTVQSSGTQTVAPPSWTMPGISNAADKVTQALNELPGQQYQGNFVAQPNMGLVNGASQIYQNAAGQAGQLGQQVLSAANDTMGLQPLTTGTFQQAGAYDINPVISAATAPLFRQLTEGTLPGLRSAAIDAGAYSGDRAMSVLPGQAITETAARAQELGAQIGYQDFRDRETQRLQAYQTDQANALTAGQFNNSFALQRAQALPGLYGDGMNLITSGGDLLQGANALEMQAQQAQIDNALRQNEYSWKYPFQGLDIASALLSQLSGNYGTTTSNSNSTQTQSTGGLGSVVQGLAGLGMMAASIPTGGGATVGGNLMSSLFKKSAPAAGGK